MIKMHAHVKPGGLFFFLRRNGRKPAEEAPSFPVDRVQLRLKLMQDEPGNWPRWPPPTSPFGWFNVIVARVPGSAVAGRLVQVVS